QLGAFLVIGFMVHNVTEGLGIAAPATRARVTLWQLAALALVAGAPAILGTWIGGYGSSDLLTPVFFALAAGAALQVVVEVARYVARIAPGGLRSGWAVGGYLGPAFVAAVAYVDPGNFATNMAGGAQFGYLLLWVILMANLMGMVVQSMSAKLGIATGMNLPEVCRERFSRRTSIGLWLQAE